jgi:hypothetical protein
LEIFVMLQKRRPRESGDSASSFGPFDFLQTTLQLLDLSTRLQKLGFALLGAEEAQAMAVAALVTAMDFHFEDRRKVTRP